MHLATLVAVVSFIIASLLQSAQSVDKPCREHPQVSGKCFNVHGRLSVYNGAPAIRIWKIGTKRILGVSDQRFYVPGYKNIPSDLQEKINQDVAITADFLVCPFTVAKASEMQLVCIDRARKVEVVKRK